MTIQEIFKLPEIKNIEIQILDCQRNIELSNGFDETSANSIRSLLPKSKLLLDEQFVMTEQYKSLLSEFNCTLKQHLESMFLNAVKGYNAIIDKGIDLYDQYPEGCICCHLGFEYSDIHPIQTFRAKKMWQVINNELDCYNQDYERCGVTDCRYWLSPESDLDMDTLNDELDCFLFNGHHNWNMWFEEREMTNKMHLIFPVYHLLAHTYFSIFDILWVRNFNTEIRFTWTKNDIYPWKI